MSDKEYFWGPATSTIDWCEENYHVSPYLAEFFNTTTNLMFMFLSLFGIYNTIKNGFKSSFIVAYLGVMLVGFGSWCFHMTLQYEMQLLDELPMIYVASVMVWHIFSVDPNYKSGFKLPLALVLYSALVTYSYLIINNPVFHQVSYALLVFTIVFKSISLQLSVPISDEKPKLERLLWFSALGFILSFIVWNIDNQFCTHLRSWRHTVSFFVGSFSELHGWWHIGTALGTYYFIVFCEWIEQVLRNKNRYTLYWHGPLCYLKPTEKTKQ